jgi:MFS family permease
VTTAVAARRRGVASLLRDRAFGPFFVGNVLSSCGIWIQNIAAAVLMFELTRSAFMVGAVSMLQFAGPLLLSLWAGALNDRLDRRKLLTAGRVVSGVAVGSLALAVALRGTGGFGGPAVLLAAVVVIGLGLARSQPAVRPVVSRLASPVWACSVLSATAASPRPNQSSVVPSSKSLTSTTTSCSCQILKCILYMTFHYFIILQSKFESYNILAA